MKLAEAAVFVCFFLSGMTALVYETVWMRLAIAHFGVNTTVVSAVLTSLMLGLAAGSVVAGRWTERLESRLGLNGFHLYAFAETLSLAGGLAVPALFGLAREKLLAMGAANSTTYTLASSGMILLCLLPFCAAMGATFPLAVSFLKKISPRASFSFLYMANALGAVCGVILASMALIEVLGLRRTLNLAAAVNLKVVVTAALTAHLMRLRVRDSEPPVVDQRPAAEEAADGSASRAALFLTGCASMGMEVVWTRLYPVYVGTFVYSFAGILATFLAATAAGALIYRRRAGSPRTATPWSLWTWICVSSILPLITASVHLSMPPYLRIFLGLTPFCGLLGYFTPALLDRMGSDPKRIGSAYGLNLLGCVVGPVLAGFILIPHLGPKYAALVLAAPLFLLFFAPAVRRHNSFRDFAILTIFVCGLQAAYPSLDELFPKEQVRHDATATVIAAGSGMNKWLAVNGIPITYLTPITKMMSHQPMAHLKSFGRVDSEPFHGLVLCFGMGTTFRSMSSWGVRTTAVELVPSVPGFFPFFFPDAPAALAGGRNRIVVDDARRFLDRTGDRFDVITVDPPPPPEASGSSLLYTREFYLSASRRLKPGGLLATWIPPADSETISAVVRAILVSFKTVRAFGSVEGWGGYQFLASQEDSIPRLSPEKLVALLPPAARSDLTEWWGIPAVSYFERMQRKEMDPGSLVLPGPAGLTVLTDDRPINEFFFMRRWALPTWKPVTMGGKALVPFMVDTARRTADRSGG